MYAGDFSFGGQGYPIYDPASLVQLPNGSYSKTQFPNNIIPASRIDPNAKILAVPDFIFPSPSNANGFYTKSFSVPTDLREEIVRVDHNFNDREQMFFRNNLNAPPSCTVRPEANHQAPALPPPARLR